MQPCKRVIIDRSDPIRAKLSLKSHAKTQKHFQVQLTSNKASTGAQMSTRFAAICIKVVTQLVTKTTNISARSNTVCHPSKSSSIQFKTKFDSLKELRKTVRRNL